MVMAVNEGVLKQGVDDSLSTKLQILRQRRELLEEKLIQKNNELKNVCIYEAGLTGVLPPETPLEPGESPPTFFSRATSTFGSITNVAPKIKNSEADELELERQIQIGLAEAALRVINDLTENRAVRRKQRSVYQQCQRKLQELETRLSFIRQSTSTKHQAAIGNIPPYAHNSAKYRMKKPRPPLSGSLRDSYVKPLHEQGGISLSPQEPEHNYNRDYFDSNRQSTPPGIGSHPYISYSISNPVERINSAKFSEHEQNINNNIYILPDQFRTRTLSQGAQRNTSPRCQTRYHEVDRIHRPLTNSYSEDDRQMSYRHYHDEADNIQKLAPHYRYMDNDAQHRISQVHSVDDFYQPYQQRYTQPVEYPNLSKNPPQIPVLRQRRDLDTISVIDGRTQVPTRYHTTDNSLGYWVRQNGDIVWYPEDKYIEKFGSLDRRKPNTVKSVVNSEAQSRYHTAISTAKNSTTSLRQNQIPNSVNNFEQPATSNRILRTQSLGSVESRQSNRELQLDKDNIDMVRRNKEKGWYETSLDSNCGSHTANTLRQINSARQECYYDHLTTVRKESEIPYRGKQIESHPEFVEIQCEEQTPFIINNVNRYYDAPKVLEIPAESKPSQHQENSNEITIPLNSPTSHTIVQPGKYQPYREVTKPFEMSDFYKYSTKFRKRNEANQMAAALASLGNEASVEHKPNLPVQNKPAHQLTQQPGQFYESR